MITTKNAKKMKECLKVVTEYGERWRCTFNSSKSKIVLHGRKTKKGETFTLGHNPLEQVLSYKYLGLEIQRNLNWKLYKERALSKATRVTTLIKALFLKNNKITIQTMTQLWNALARPILEYGAEIWGFRKWAEADRLHRSFGRFLLGHKKHSSNASVYGDLGWTDLGTRREKIQIRYWRKLTEMKDTSTCKLIFEEDMRHIGKNSWSLKMKAVMEKNILGLEWRTRSTALSKPQWETKVDKIVADKFKEKWREECRNNKKLEVYTEHGGDFGPKKYLENFNIRSRDIMARLRSGSNELRIDEGRRLRLDRRERNCLLCRQETESTTHFLLKCPVLEKNRTLLKKKLNDLWKNLPKKDQWDTEYPPWEKIFLGSSNNKNVNKNVLSFIHSNFNLRKKILKSDLHIPLSVHDLIKYPPLGPDFQISPGGGFFQVFEKKMSPQGGGFILHFSSRLL